MDKETALTSARLLANFAKTSKDTDFADLALEASQIIIEAISDAPAYGPEMTMPDCAGLWWVYEQENGPPTWLLVRVHVSKYADGGASRQRAMWREVDANYGWKPCIAGRWLKVIPPEN